MGISGTGEGVNIEDRVSEFGKQFGVTFPEDVDKIVLGSTTGEPTSGLATRDRKQPVTVTILANLPDTKLGYTVRLANIKGVFHPNELCKSYKSVLLIDDVVTTGATINAVADALKNGGVRNVYCAAIAKTQQTFRRKPKAEKL